MKKLLLSFAITLVTFCSAQSQVYKTSFIDFGPNDITNGNITPGQDANGNYWNNATDPNLAAAPLNLIDNKNVSSGSTLVVSLPMLKNGIQNGGLLAPSSGLLKQFAVATATQDYFHTPASGSVTLRGLNKTRGYIFSLFGTRNDTETRITTYTLLGTNQYSGALQTSGTNLGGTGYNGNNSTVLVTKTIMPSSNGEITIVISKTAGAFAYLGALKMEEVNGVVVSPFCASKDPYKIAWMGSSVSFGTGATNNQGYVYQYTQQLANRYNASTGRNWNVNNISIGGNNTIDLINRWDKDLLPRCSKYVVYGVSLGNEGIITAGQAAFDQFKNNLQLLIDKAKAEGIIPIIANCYTRNDYTLTEYNYVKQMNALINSWDVASINLLGAVDNGSGQWSPSYFFDALHPNDAGHTEMMYAIVPSLFDAMDAGKTQPKIINGTSISLSSATNYKIEFAPEETLHPFTLSFDIKTSGAGSMSAFETTTGKGILSIVSGSGKVQYKSATSAGIAGVTTVTNNEWHKVTLTHYYALGQTLLYVDNILQGAVSEKIIAKKFTLGGATSPMAGYRNLLFYRSAINAAEIAALASNQLLKSSLEIYSPLDAQGVTGNDTLVNIAQSQNKIVKVKNNFDGPAILYKDCGFIGNAVELGEGDYTLAALASKGIANDDISSIKIKAGFKIVGFKDDNFGGASITISASDDCLVNEGFNDQITSLKIVTSGVTGMDGTWFLKNSHSNLYLDVPGGNLSDGVQWQQLALNNSAEQQFILSDIGGGVYTVTNLNSGKVMDVDGAKDDNGAKVQQRSYANGKNQQWILIAADAGFYKFVARHSIKILEIGAWSTADGGMAQQWTNENQSSGQWKLVPAPGNIATVYKHCNYDVSGYSAKLTTGKYTLAQLLAKGIADNDLSAVKLSDGYEMLLYTDDNLTGTSLLVKTDNSCLAANNFNDITTSLRIQAVSNTVSAKRSANKTSESKSTLNTFPNPFAQSISVETENENDGRVSVTVYNMNGQVVKKLFEGYLAAGIYQFVFDATTLEDNIYFVKYIYKNKVVTKKIMKLYH